MLFELRKSIVRIVAKLVRLDIIVMTNHPSLSGKYDPLAGYKKALACYEKAKTLQKE